MNKSPDEVEEFDFGFSFSDDVLQDQETHQNDPEEMAEQIEDLQNRIDLLLQTMMPFLDNLCKNPEKSTIHWPDRVIKIDQFRNRLTQIAEGK
jgi:hypothetical protein